MRNVVLILVFAAFCISASKEEPTTPTIKWEYARCVRLEDSAHKLRYLQWRERGSGFLTQNEGDFIKKIGGKVSADEEPQLDMFEVIGARGWEMCGVEVDYARAMTVTYWFKRPTK